MYKEYNINDNRLKKLNYVKNNLDSTIYSAINDLEEIQ